MLEERGVSTGGKRLIGCDKHLFDFVYETIEHMLIDKGPVPCFLPKFHSDINPTDSVGATEEIYQGAL